ncbi:lipase family protein [Nocardia sp. NPDC051570]|uniref:lipase family protein n=1 Tax=Nocardia sp. NPDC051570 TaxID=3364324 RepID=UPI0037B28E9A
MAVLVVFAIAAAPANADPADGTLPAEPLVPQADPFYEPPPDFATAAPGAILRSRPVRLGTPAKEQSWQLLYRTTDLFGNPDATVTTVILPDNAPPNRPLLSYQLFEDASGPTCVASYELQEGAPVATSTIAQKVTIPQILDEGWAVSLPDFQGRFGHFAAAKEPGYMTLDGIRAAEQFAPLGLNPQTKTALFGYSGGGLSTGWAAEMHPSYAPEINLVGTAMGGPPSDFDAAARANNGTFFSGLVGSGIAALYKAYPEFNAELRPHLTPEGVAAFDFIGSQCLVGDILAHMARNWSQYMDISLDEMLSLPAARATMALAALGQSAPTTPMLAYQAVHDEIVPAFTTDRLVEKYCAAGTPVTYIHDETAEHLVLAAAGPASGLSWLEQRLNTDIPAPSGCSTQSVLSMVPPQSINIAPIPGPSR